MISKYISGFDELNVLITEYELGNEKDLKKSLDRFEEFLIDAYLLGFKYSTFLLKLQATPPLIDLLSLSYKGQSVAQKYEEYFVTKDKSSIKKLAESEYHKAFNLGGYEAAKQAEVKVFKEWVTMADDKVRFTHTYLEGIKKDITEYYFTPDGDYALYPGSFQDPSNNVNCRCYLKYSRG